MSRGKHTPELSPKPRADNASMHQEGREMGFATATRLARNVEAGDYTPSTLEGCEATVTRDEQPTTIRFADLTLFGEPEPRARGAPRYLIVQPHVAAGTPDDERDLDIERYVRPVLERVVGDLPTADLPPPEAMGADELRQRLRRLVAADPGAEEAATIRSERLAVRSLPRLNLDDEALQSAYGAWLADQEDRILRRRLSPLVDLGLLSLPVDERVTADPDRLAQWVSGVLYPTPFQPFASPFAHIALCATLEQEWTPVGYTRGELLNSVSLAPGEQLTLEYHSWDKRSRKSEQELATESEVRTSEKLTQRDALTVAQEMARQRNTNVNINTVVPLPKMPVTLGANASTQASESLSRTEERVRESTVEAANSLRVNRKARIEVSRDTGREERQTRVLENTNRCHTLNCHYFEVVANYLVTTRVVSIQPCALLANPRRQVTPEWVLCHQDVLRASLVDSSFLAGFEAARLLRAADVLERIREQRAAARLEQQGEALAPHVSAITGAWLVLQQAHERVVAAIDECGGGGPRLLLCLLDELSIQDVERTAALMALAPGTRAALGRLATDDAAGENAATALRRFLASSPPADPLEGASPEAVMDRLRDLGLHKQVASAVVKDPARWDDAGLGGATEAARTYLSSMADPDEAGEAQIGLRELAEAEIAFEQLRCHLEAHWLHYLRSVWLREDHGQRFIRLQDDGIVATLIDNELLGFFADKAAYPLRRTDGLQSELNLDGILTDVREGLETSQSDPVLVSLPTPGTVLEAVTGQCNACEDFITESRALDLRLHEAGARQAESEADRRSARVSEGDLSDPHPEPGGLLVEVKRAPESDTAGR